MHSFFALLKCLTFMNKKHLPFYTTKEDIFKNLLKMGVSSQLAIFMKNTTNHHNSKTSMNIYINATQNFPPIF